MSMIHLLKKDDLAFNSFLVHPKALVDFDDKNGSFVFIDTSRRGNKAVRHPPPEVKPKNGIAIICLAVNISTVLVKPFQGHQILYKCREESSLHFALVLLIHQISLHLTLFKFQKTVSDVPEKVKPFLLLAKHGNSQESHFSMCGWVCWFWLLACKV